MTVKLGSIVPTIYVTNKATGSKMKINTADFNPKVHAKIVEEAPAQPEPEPKPKVEPKAKPKAK